MNNSIKRINKLIVFFADISIKLFLIIEINLIITLFILLN